MPFGDLTVSEGTVIKWLKAVGDPVKAGELIAEIETDKAVVEIEAPVSGTLEHDRPAGRRRSCRWAGASAASRSNLILAAIGRVSMKILCANWQAADEAELERKHYPDIEFILARSTNEKAAELDPASAGRSTPSSIIRRLTMSRRRPTAFPNARIAVRSGVGFDNIDTAGWGARKIPGLQCSRLWHDRGRRPRHRPDAGAHSRHIQLMAPN